ncbi:hypothetical protein CTAYLR_003277 [Chrysophaeum taylorii]|uniref:3-phosphoshikimate 1-carboxyvinyltransferase n=1 Tax=Chrysophaeum taylorii TaxID=2483200 RepID=A0AAD7XH36_9STRA|nr:hypothetical protein CTAYLR_003277 [Chrysophaeum taylorii]
MTLLLVALLVARTASGFSLAATGRPRASFSATVESIDIAPIPLATGVVRLPGSKSLSNRALLIAALCEGETLVENLLASDDTERMLEALAALGVGLERRDEGRSVLVRSSGVLSSYSELTLMLGNAGTAMRPLAAVLAACEGSFVLDGTPRMRERPIEDLVNALGQLGCDVECAQNPPYGGCPPVSIEGAKGRVDGGECRISGKTSSQFLSALLLASPLLAATEDVVVHIVDDLISAPYVVLTIDLMRRFGVEVDYDDTFRQFRVRAGQRYDSRARLGGTYFVEGDASSASYFLAAAAMTGGPITVVGCGSESTQGDVRFAEVLAQMGATVDMQPTNITVSRDPASPLEGVDVDCLDIPDAAMTLASVALVARGDTTIRNVASWRVKETERMKAIVAETTKLGATVFEGDDYCVITPPPDNTPLSNVVIETYDDHRIAMTFALAACAGVPVTILDPKCTSKTFPTYFDELARVSSLSSSSSSS